MAVLVVLQLCLGYQLWSACSPVDPQTCSAGSIALASHSSCAVLRHSGEVYLPVDQTLSTGSHAKVKTHTVCVGPGSREPWYILDSRSERLLFD